ncbi:hypothetical protein [Aeromonas diversa]|uniref:hypothetical protein n=1 Tax=Aeromonas diversa TaxID=502790 RepID=UPI003462CC4D
MKINHELIEKVIGKSGRSLEHMLMCGDLTEEELLEFSLFVASVTVPTGGILGKSLMDSIKHGLNQKVISGLNPALQGLHIAQTQHEMKVSESAKRKARKVALNGDEVLELAYLMAVADEYFFQQLRTRVENDWQAKVWSQEELIAQLTHKRAHLFDEQEDDEQSRLH